MFKRDHDIDIRIQAEIKDAQGIMAQTGCTWAEALMKAGEGSHTVALTPDRGLRDPGLYC
jgi:hypothetical protein